MQKNSPKKPEGTIKARRNGSLILADKLIMPDIFEILQLQSMKSRQERSKRISQLRNLTIIRNDVISHHDEEEFQVELGTKKEILTRFNQLRKLHRENPNLSQNVQKSTKKQNNTYYETLLVFEAEKLRDIKLNDPRKNNQNLTRLPSKNQDTRLISTTQIHLDSLYEESRLLLKNFNFGFVNREQAVKRSERLDKIYKSAIGIFNTKVKKML